MSVERQYGKIIFVCDVGRSPKCEELIHTGESDFYEALAAMKAAGWQAISQRHGGGWLHWCKNCPRPR